MPKRVRTPLTRSVVDVLGAATSALLVFTAVPAVLLLVVGNPLSGGLGHSWPNGSRDALCVLAAAAWVAWAACCIQLLREVVDCVRQGDIGVHAVVPCWTDWRHASPSVCLR